MKISILGSGSFGSALAQVLCDANQRPIIWSHTLDSKEKFISDANNYIDSECKKLVFSTTDLEDINNSDMVLVAVPSFALRETAQKIKPYIKDDTIIVLCSKGIEKNTFKTGAEIFEDELPSHKLAILSGPTHAEEISKRLFTAIVATSTDLEVAKKIQKIFSTPYFRVYTNTDIKGVELAGSVKNILAIAAGYCDASPYLGDNTKALLLTRGLRELKILTELYGGSKETIYGLTGVGDLMVTAFSKHSRNRRFGELLGSGLSVDDAQKEIGMVVEGYYSLSAIHQLIHERGLDLPVIDIIYKAVYHDIDIDQLYEIGSKRSLKSEE